MDTNLNTSIIEKVAIKSVAIYKAIAMLPPPPFEDKFAKETICQTEKNIQKTNSEKCLNETERKTEEHQSDTMNETKTVNELESLNITTQTKSGIYKIINKVNGKYYVGSSQNIKCRWENHKSNLKKNKHWNKHLQNAYNKYGVENFEYVIIEYVNVIQLLEVEQKYLDECKNNPDTNYMIAYDSTAPMRGKIPWNKGTKGLMPPAWNKNKKGIMPPSWNKGKPLTEKQKQHLRLRADQQYTDEFRKKHSEYCKSKEHRDKISEGKKDKTVHTFLNEKTGEYFTGCTYDWYKKYLKENPRNVTSFMKGKRKRLYGWILVTNQASSLELNGATL